MLNCHNGENVRILFDNIIVKEGKLYDRMG